MIEMLGKLFEDLVDKMERSDALYEIDQIAHKACGLPVSVLLRINPEDIRDSLSDLQRYFAAELLMIEIAIQQRAMMEDELFPRRSQILEILAALKEPDYLIPACDHARRIFRECEDPLPAELLITMADLFERGGQYDQAEDMLYVAKDQSEDVKPLILSFYQRLSQMDDRALFAGGLPRNEVEEGMRSL